MRPLSEWSAQQACRWYCCSWRHEGKQCVALHQYSSMGREQANNDIGLRLFKHTHTHTHTTISRQCPCSGNKQTRGGRQVAINVFNPELKWATVYVMYVPSIQLPSNLRLANLIGEQARIMPLVEPCGWSSMTTPNRWHWLRFETSEHLHSGSEESMECTSQRKPKSSPHVTTGLDLETRGLVLTNYAQKSPWTIVGREREKERFILGVGLFD